MENSTVAPDGPASPLDTAAFRWLDLPAELQIKVCECFVAGPLPMGSSSKLSPDIAQCRETLLSLCQTSWHGFSVAMPLLYRHVIITDYAQIPSVLATLLSHEHRLTWARSLSVLANVIPEKYDWATLVQNLTLMMNTVSRFDTKDIEKAHPKQSETARELEQLSERLRMQTGAVLGLFPDDDDSQDEDSRSRDYPGSGGEDELNWDNFPWHTYERDVRGVNERLLQLLLGTQQNVKDIFVTVPEGPVAHLCPRELAVNIMRLFRTNSRMDSFEDPFARLRTIRKQRSLHILGGLRPDLHKPEYRRSTHWELFRDDGNWTIRMHLDEFGWPRLPRRLMSRVKIFKHITKLGLYESRTHPALLRLILSHCKNLRELEYTTNALKWNKLFGLTQDHKSERVAAPTLQQALKQVRATLTHLRVGWAPLGAVLMEDAEAAVADHQIDLSRFAHIQSAEVDPPFVLVDDSDDRDSTK